MQNNEELLEFSFDYEALDACPLCRGEIMIPNGKIKWLGIDFWYVICPVCDLKFMNPRPTQASYQKFYKDFFWQQKVRNIGFKQEGQIWQGQIYQWDNDKVWDPEEGRKNKIEKLRTLRFGIITETLSRYITLDEDKRILEVGCSFGVILHELNKKYQCEVYAIEPSTEAQEAIREFGNIRLLGSYGEELESISKSDLKFDAIIFSHALENTSIPFDIMRWAAECLKPNGIVYVQCSNLFTYDQMNPYHPYIFSFPAFKVLAEKLGAGIERVTPSLDKMLTVIFAKNPSVLSK
mgnify:CR=1 FL=1